MIINEKNMHNIGAYIKYKSDSDIGILIVDREHVLGAWKDVNNINIVYQLTLFCNKLFEDVSGFYPDFSGWVSRKVVPGIINGDREIIIALNAEKQIGYSVIKNTVKEKKICTLYVEPEARSQHIGTALLNISKIRLKEDHPLITVSEDRVHFFEKLFNGSGFVKIDGINDLYVKGKTEFVYNRELTDE